MSEIILHSIDLRDLIKLLDNYNTKKLTTDRKDLNRLIDAFICNSIDSFGLADIIKTERFNKPQEYHWFAEQHEAYSLIYKALKPIFRNETFPTVILKRINGVLFLIIKKD